MHIILGSLLLSSSVYAADWATELKPKIDAVVAENFANQSQVGVVVGVLREGRMQFWNYGETALGSGIAPTEDTYFEMGSITKTFTATMLALEVEKKHVALSDKVASLWPELAGTDVGNITLQALATHTSGLPRMPDNFAPSDPLNPYKNYDAQAMLAYLKAFKQTGAGPYSYAYSNIGVGLLGYLLAEKLNGLSYADYLKPLLTELGLTRTKTALAEANLANSAQGYNSFLREMPFWNLGAVSGAGVLKTTSRDLLRYLDFNMNADSTTEIGRAMLLAQKQLEPTDQADVTVGLIWSATKLGAYDVITHSGATGGYRANAIFDPKQKVGAVVLANTAEMPNCVLAVVFDVPCAVPQWHKPSAAIRASYEGTYESTDLKMRARVFRVGDALALQADGQPETRLWARSDSVFVIPGAQALVTFATDHFVLEQGGQSYRFDKQ